MDRKTFEDAHKWTYTRNMRGGCGFWDRIDDWVFPTRKNSMKSRVFYHVCDGNRKTQNHIRNGIANISERLDPDGCKACGEKVPDGLKMVVILLGI